MVAGSIEFLTQTWMLEVPVGGLRTERKPSESTLVIRGLCDAIADGTLHAGRKISERALAARVQLSSGAVSDALRQLAEDGLVNQDDTGSLLRAHRDRT